MQREGEIVLLVGAREVVLPHEPETNSVGQRKTESGDAPVPPS